MDSKIKIQNRLDEAMRFRTLSVVFSVEGAILSFIVAYFSIWRGWFSSGVLDLALLPLIYVILCSVASYVMASMDLKAYFEEEEKILLEKRKNKSALDIGEDVLFVAKRSSDNFRKYSPYVISAIKISVALIFLLLYYQYLKNQVMAPVTQGRVQPAFVSFMIALACLFTGIFAVGQSREKNFRWLRVSGSWLIMAFAIFAFSALAILLANSGYPEWDARIRNVFFVILSLIGLELFLNFIMEFYRPKGEMEERPVFESRFLSLFSEPGGLAQNMAETLDYQFGFKISGTWLYRLIETSVIPLFVLWLFSLWLMTCFVQIYPNELGIREAFGILEKGEPLRAGIHFKLPYPYGRITRIPANDIQEIFVGTGIKEEENKAKQEENHDIILWTVSHYAKETKFLVASDRAVSENEVPVSYIASIFNIQYKIDEKGLLKYHYGNQNTRKTIMAVSEGVITKFLAGNDMIKMLSLERQTNQKLILGLLQKACDENELGVEIVFVNILDVHPPVEKVAPSFQEVVGAIEEKESEILKAKAYENKVIPMAEAESSKVILDAETESKNVVVLASSENERFTKQLDAYRQMPRMFKLRTYLNFFENDCANVRKLVVDSDMAYNVFMLNFEEKQRLDLLDVSLGDIAPEKNK